MKLEQQCCTLEQAEIWKDIPGYEGLYKASNTGNKMALKRSGSKGSIRMQEVTKRGYLRVILSKENRRKNMSVHRLIAMAWLPNIEILPVVNHIDGNKKNNRVENLEWCNHKWNSLHATQILKIGTGELNGRAKLTQREVDFLRFLKFKYPEISSEYVARFYGMSGTSILMI